MVVCINIVDIMHVLTCLFQIQQQKEERRKKKRERQKPDRQVYRPPHHRKEATPTTVNYRIDIEVHPKTYWRREVSQVNHSNQSVGFKCEGPY